MYEISRGYRYLYLRLKKCIRQTPAQIRIIITSPNEEFQHQTVNKNEQTDINDMNNTVDVIFWILYTIYATQQEEEFSTFTAKWQSLEVNC